MPAPAATLACARCRYDLAGLPADGDCPECGFPIQASVTSTNPHLLLRCLACGRALNPKERTRCRACREPVDRSLGRPVCWTSQFERRSPLTYLAPDARAPGDETCLFCKTPLANLPASDACPTCNAPVSRTLLRNAATSWTPTQVRNVRRWLLATTILPPLTFLPIILQGLIPAALLTRVANTVSVDAAVSFTSAALACAWSTAWFFIPRPLHPTRPARIGRLTLRIPGLALFIAVLAFVLDPIPGPRVSPLDITLLPIMLHACFAGLILRRAARRLLHPRAQEYAHGAAIFAAAGAVTAVSLLLTGTEDFTAGDTLITPSPNPVRVLRILTIILGLISCAGVLGIFAAPILILLAQFNLLRRVHTIATFTPPPHPPAPPSSNPAL